MDTDQEQDVLKLSTGVVLRLRRPSSMLVMEATKALMADEPRPPRVFIQEKEREEENPNDPDYIAAHNIWLAEVGVRSLKALIPTGTAMESKPEDVVGPEDEDFADLMAAMGQEAAPGRYSRYVQWVMSVACSGADLEILSMRLMRLSGIREEDVAEMLAGFPGLEERLANTGGAPDGGDPDRDPLPQRAAEASVPG